MVGTTLMPMKTNIYKEYGVKYVKSNSTDYMRYYMTTIYNKKKFHCVNCNKDLVRNGVKKHLNSNFHKKRNLENENIIEIENENNLD